MRSLSSLSIVVLAVALAIPVAPALPSSARAASPSPGGERFAIGRVKYTGGGDWYSNPSSLPNIHKQLSDRVGIPTQERGTARLAPRREPLRDAVPLYEWTRHRDVLRRRGRAAAPLSSRAGASSGPTTTTAWTNRSAREMRKVFPDAEWIELPFDHEIYHCFYDLAGRDPEDSRAPRRARPRARDLPRGAAGRLLQLQHGHRGRAPRTPSVHDDPPDKREAAMQMAMNVVVYALSH